MFWFLFLETVRPYFFHENRDWFDVATKPKSNLHNNVFYSQIKSDSIIMFLCLIQRPMLRTCIDLNLDFMIFYAFGLNRFYNDRNE